AYVTILQGVLRRGLLLVFFAITLAYLTPGNLTAQPWVNYLTSLVTFLFYFLVFMRFKGSPLRRYCLQAIGFLVIAGLTYYHSEVQGNTFDKSKNNIIILVLANMAVFGSLCWLLTARNFYLRIAILVGFIGVWLTRSIEGSWTSYIWNFHPKLHWFYNFSFLKYLCIVLPGSILGDLIWKNREIFQREFTSSERKATLILGTLSFLFVAFHVLCLYERWITVYLVGHVVFGILFYYFLKDRKEDKVVFYKQLVFCGFMLSTVGLLFVRLDRGIDKDPASFR